MTPHAEGDGSIVCQTPRLVLRHLQEGDLEQLTAMLADPEVTRYIGGPRTREQTRARLTELIGQYQTEGYSKWAVVLRATGECIGRCGPAVVDVSGAREVEIGYDLAKHYWGQGLAKEAATAALQHSFTVLGLRRVVSLISPENAASQSVAKHLGMGWERDVVWRGWTMKLYAREAQAG